jgi:hypothetical protein
MVHATACNVERLAMSSTPVSSLALIGVQLDCIGVALKEVLAGLETARIAAAQAAEHETAPGRTTCRTGLRAANFRARIGVKRTS